MFTLLVLSLPVLFFGRGGASRLRGEPLMVSFSCIPEGNEGTPRALFGSPRRDRPSVHFWLASV